MRIVRMDITKVKHIHFTGIKGVGMTALSLCAKDLNIQITGSDTEELFVTDKILKEAGIKWSIGFGKKNLNPRPDLVVTTGAHGGLNNPEVLEAKKMKIEVATYSEALSMFANKKKLISVCGVGGKGSTSSMIATILELAGVNPSFAIGIGDIFPLGKSGKYNNTSKYFICEADEYAISPGINNKPKFSILNPFITVVTNIEHDHPDIYSTFDETIKVYKEYFKRIPNDGRLIANIDNKNTLQVAKEFPTKLETYGFSERADWKISDVNFFEGKTAFKLTDKNKKVHKVNIKIPGKYNILNATAAFIVASRVGVTHPEIIKYLELYQGARRRFENMGKKNGVFYYDDYAHHPSEIREVLEAAKRWYSKKRIIALFQPHTYSRTKVFLDEFSNAFESADIVGFMNIYASARESKDESINSQILTEKTKPRHKKVYYVGGHQEALAWLNKITKSGDIVLTMGAGDIFHLYKDLNLQKQYFS